MEGEDKMVNSEEFVIPDMQPYISLLSSKVVVLYIYSICIESMFG